MGKEMQADIVIIGGSTGGCAAALAACRLGKSVIMTEECDWIGGQLTSQAVPPDEHQWIEYYGSTRSYRQYRQYVRQYYQDFFPLTPDARQRSLMNPGNAIVSRISHEPRAAYAVIKGMLAPYEHSGKLTILTGYRVESCEREADQVTSATVKDSLQGEEITLTAPYFLDATECGDLLPLANIEYVTGAESRADTGEPHALDGPADPMDMQAITHCYAVDYIEGEDHTIEKPEDYAFWQSYQADFWPERQLSWYSPKPRTLEKVEYTLFPRDDLFSLWRYRRVIDKSLFKPGTFASDITMVNWPQNDYWLGSVIDVSEEERQKHLRAAKQLSLSLLYWMQTEAPRPDGKQGYPGLRLRPDVVGTRDGLAQQVYIRESRRILAEFTVVEQHLSPDTRADQKSVRYQDSVGVGYYHIDLHPSTAGRNYIDVSSLPFHIPLGSLIPITVDNVLPSCKNIGTTHITNGCYRLHPVEWNIGESVGTLAAYCLDHGYTPREVLHDARKLESFQQLLVQEGVELTWP
ncbi:FAD-dependent oxidoreductase [Paenibacillus abyssi]|uniref:FAD-dependent oxidoreductase n=1 Tax=Paenibacillus abyssi TaxID=1340531 RepID=A0A917LIF6_9BACL|nr:FAD-dependent oxidoreductase [Paenibacillus abyssi]GGG26377.1 FAD-dependent oxidoreductase [Paenibacillus abyssi]